jgi:hypothetical protein
MSDPFGRHAVLCYPTEDLTRVLSIERFILALVQHNFWLGQSGFATMQLVIDAMAKRDYFCCILTVCPSGQV